MCGSRRQLSCPDFAMPYYCRHRFFGGCWGGHRGVWEKGSARCDRVSASSPRCL